MPSPARPALSARLHDAGLSRRQVARTLGVTHTTINGDVEDFFHADVPTARKPREHPWSDKVQRVTATIPYEALSDDDLDHALGAAPNR